MNFVSNTLNILIWVFLKAFQNNAIVLSNMSKLFIKTSRIVWYSSLYKLKPQTQIRHLDFTTHIFNR